MPGKRHRWLVTEGPHRGSRVRLLAAPPEGGGHTQIVELTNHTTALVPSRWIKPIPQKSTRPKGGKGAHRRRVPKNRRKPS